MLFRFILEIFRFLFSFFSPYCFYQQANLLKLEKENQILRRTLRQKGIKPRIDQQDRFFLALLYKLFPQGIQSFSLFTPETLLKWYRQFLKSFWAFPQKSKPRGRPRTPLAIRNLILKMKNENRSWGNKRIRDELLKLSIDLDKNTIANIIHEFRRQGKIQPVLSWSKFIHSQINSLFCMDYFTADSAFGKHFYVFFILRHLNREIVQFAITTTPNREFVRQQMILLKENHPDPLYMIHDNAPEFIHFPFQDYGVNSVPTSVRAPNMNAYAERFVRSVRSESLDWFIIFNRFQLHRILKEYVIYYNSLRPHQGINRVPLGYEPQKKGTVVSDSILFGLHHHHHRIAA